MAEAELLVDSVVVIFHALGSEDQLNGDGNVERVQQVDRGP